MIITAVPRAVLQLQYHAVRLPIMVVHTRILGRYLPEDSPLRLSFERVLGSLDSTAGRLLADQTLQQRGTAMRQHAAVRTAAAQLEHVAQRRRGQAEQQLTAVTEDTAGRRKQAQRNLRDDIAETLRDEEADKRQVAEQVQARVEAETNQTLAAGGERLAALDEQRIAAQARIDTREQQATAQPKEALKAAGNEKSDADQRRGDADRLNHLAANERNQRRAGH